MNIGASLSLSQKQTLKLNAQMFQSLELMTLPLPELRQKIAEELQVNPTLTLDAPREASLDSIRDDFARIDGKGEDYSDSSSYGGDEKATAFNAWLEGAVTGEETLQDHLNEELGISSCTDEVRAVCALLISNLDANGFHTKAPESLLKDSQKPYLKDALTLLQSFDPAGIGVKDYRESLVLQARMLNVKDQEMEAFTHLVYDCLDKMRAGKNKEVAKELGIDDEDLDALFSFLKTLTPYPGQKYNAAFQSVITPDLSIKKDEDRLVLCLNTGALPVLSIDEGYEQMEKELAQDKKEKDADTYLKTQLQNANNLINQVKLRNQTLEKVGIVLLDRQKGFFLFGPQSLKPLTLKDVADIVGVHETTISRITTSKYIDTDYGVFPLKMLFSGAVGGKRDDGKDGMAKNAIKDVIRQIIGEYTGTKALSDQKLSDMLEEKGIHVARRTVAKYRKELNIDSSFVRGT